MLSHRLNVSKILLPVLKNLYCTSAQQQDIPVVRVETRSSIAKSKIKKPPFVQNLFVGVFDKDYLVFPEGIPADILQALEQLCLELNHTLDNKDLKPGLNKTTINALVNLNSFYPESSNNKEGVPFSCTETVRISEVLGRDPELSLSLEYHKVVIKLLLQYGTQEQKDKYLSKLLRGDIIGGVALCDENGGSSPADIKANYLEDVVSKKIILNGKKTWITNGTFADVFIVFAAARIDNAVVENSKRDLSAFIIDKNTPGVKIEPHSTTGLRNCGLASCTLTNVEVSPENVLSSVGAGFEVAANVLKCPKYHIVSSVLVNLKSILNETTKVILPREFSTGKVAEFENVKRVLGGAATTLYTLESMLYNHAGAADLYDSDNNLEAFILSAYAADRGIKAIESCIKLLGVREYDADLPYGSSLLDLKSIASAFQTCDFHHLFIAFTGIEYSVKAMETKVKQNRNPLNFPAYFFKRLIFNHRQLRGIPKLELNLFEQLHPSLKDPAEQLEYCVLRVQYAVEHLLTTHGREIVHRQVELQRVARAIIHIFGMTSALARASRSYCTGIRFNDKELIFARLVCSLGRVEVMSDLEKVFEGMVTSEDYTHFKISEEIFENSGYFIEHSLSRNIT